MDAYKKELRRRALQLGVTVAAAAVFVAVAGVWGARVSEGSNEHLASFMHGVPVGAFAALLVIGAISVVKIVQAIKNPEKLRAMHVEETDERSLLIQAKSLAMGFWITILALVAAMTIASFFNPVVAVTLFGVLAFMGIVKIATTLYHQRKY